MVGQNKRFVLGLDLDAVVADYETGLRTLFVEKLNNDGAFRKEIILNFSEDKKVSENRKRPDVAKFLEKLTTKSKVTASDIPQKTTWDFDEWGLTVEGHKLFNVEAITKHNLYENLDLIEGAKENLETLRERLREEGFELKIKVITSRFYGAEHSGVNKPELQAAAEKQTATWLKENEIPHDELHVCGNKEEVEAVYIDDGPGNIETFRREGLNYIIFDQLYNRHLSGPRAETWGEVPGRVIDLLRQNKPPAPSGTASFWMRSAESRGHGLRMPTLPVRQM